MVSSAAVFPVDLRDLAGAGRCLPALAAQDLDRVVKATMQGAKAMVRRAAPVANVRAVKNRAVKNRVAKNGVAKNRVAKNVVVMAIVHQEAMPARARASARADPVSAASPVGLASDDPASTEAVSAAPRKASTEAVLAPVSADLRAAMAHGPKAQRVRVKDGAKAANAPAPVKAQARVKAPARVKVMALVVLRAMAPTTKPKVEQQS